MKRLTTDHPDRKLIQELERTAVWLAEECPSCRFEDECCPDGCVIIKRAAARLEQLTATEPNDPLTLEELREMDGEPVWLRIAGGVWGLVDTDDSVVWLDRGGSIEPGALVGLAYRRKPEEE